MGTLIGAGPAGIGFLLIGAVAGPATARDDIVVPAHPSLTG